MKKIEVKVLHPALLELAFKNFSDFGHIYQIITRKFGSQIIVLPWITAKRPPDHGLRISIVISPGGIEIIDPMVHGISHHFLCLFHIDIRFCTAA